MRIVGVVAEYNPFHYGHAYQLRSARARGGYDYVVVCMAGSFTQRGEAACMDKWTRARIALQCGADAVFELPTLFAVRTADKFARGGVTILQKLGCDGISFGCETDDLGFIEAAARLRASEPEAVSTIIREKLDAGMGYARAQGAAWAEVLGVDAETLNAPNTVLAVEYVRALRALGSEMEILPIRRLGAYHDPQLTACEECGAPLMCFSSASAIRTAMRAGADWHPFVPEVARVPTPPMRGMDDLLLYALRRMTAAEIARLPDVSEGLERRVKKYAATAATAAELIEGVQCKRYTRARIARLCAHALLGLDAEFAACRPEPEYARLIGIRGEATPLLRELKARSSLKIVSNATMLADDAVFQLECRATDLRALLCVDPVQRAAGREFTEKFIRV